MFNGFIPHERQIALIGFSEKSQQPIMQTVFLKKIGTYKVLNGNIIGDHPILTNTINPLTMDSTYKDSIKIIMDSTKK